ncbi:hypothetical protein CY652_13415 [Burkholderia sp. WAC0059]|uniref:hypothetical protein n=1 Tax=Burkholderia sp. WAC0059 TaxID=2066022 RepID=UPI000C7E9729|nr:hypothetical protein [Burkholderia sp. WAC0059]PLZ02019.1 hypothetical protein CY652_13415 [Burkholderia sp. WAC0059]
MLLKRRTLLALLGLLAAAGCSTRGQVDPGIMQIATAPLTCSGKTECDQWWQRSLDWVQDHSTYQVQTATDTLIQTSGPGGGQRALAYEITKTDNGDGTSTIGFSAHCDSSLGCRPNPWQAGADFKQFVRTGENAPPSATGTGAERTTVSPSAAEGASSSAAQ